MKYNKIILTKINLNENKLYFILKDIKFVQMKNFTNR